MLKKFRPQNLAFSFKSWASESYNVADFNWYVTDTPYRTSCVNARVFAKLHYLAEHAPDTIRNRWSSAYDRFMREHMPSNAYIKWCNEYTSTGRL